MSIRFAESTLVILFAALWLSGCSLLNRSPEMVDGQAGQKPVPEELTEAYSQGLSLLKDGDFAQAETHWAGLTTQYAQFPGNWVNLAIAQLRLEKYEESLASVTQAQSINAQYCPAHQVKALAERELGKFRDAEQSYLAAIACNPDNLDARYNLGILYDLYLHDLAKALEQYQKVQAANESADETLAIWITDLERRSTEQVAGEGS